MDGGITNDGGDTERPKDFGGSFALNQILLALLKQKVGPNQSITHFRANLSLSGAPWRHPCFETAFLERPLGCRKPVGLPINRVVLAFLSKDKPVEDGLVEASDVGSDEFAADY